MLLATAGPTIAQDGVPPPLVHVPSARPGDADEARLGRAIDNMLKLIGQPDPRYATFASLSSTARLWLVRTGPKQGIASVDGVRVRDALTKILTPPPGAAILPGKPEVRVDGNFGRVTVTLGSLERGRPVGGCMTLYADAVRDGDGWAFVHLVLTRQATRCPA
jgi:hypothetical protein